MAKYFSKTYGEARWLFKEAALDLSKKYKYAEYRTIRIPSRTDSDLTIDTFYLPAQVHHEKFIVMSSGVHGVEGMTGSAIELLCMKEDVITSRVNKATTGILFIHSINPYGQKYHRRVTENNIDLGRNFIPGNESFTPLAHDADTGVDYATLAPYLNPLKKYSHSLLRRLGFRMQSFSLRTKHKMTELRQGILAGQYEFEKGIFYGGRSHEPQVGIIEEFLAEYLSKYKQVFAIDLHTGYGAPGELHFVVPYAKKNDAAAQIADKVFEGLTIECSAPGCSYADSYEVKGSFLQFVEHLSKGKTFIPIVFKFGNIDNRKVSAQVRALERIINENQCFQFGYKTEKDKKLIQKAFRDTYFPENEIWRERASEMSRKALATLIDRFQKL
jgi:hypothetical protein